MNARILYGIRGARHAGLFVMTLCSASAIAVEPPLTGQPPEHAGHQAAQPADQESPEQTTTPELTTHLEDATGRALPESGGTHAGHGAPPPAAPPAADHSAHGADPAASSGLDMGSMQGGRAPPDARDPNAYSDGYEYTGMPGMEQSDRIAFGKVLLDELEFLTGNEGDGYAWSAQGNYGPDESKLWWRTQGLKVPGELDPTTSGELLWWRPYSAFWGSLLGIRQDFGRGAHTYLAVGAEGLAPYWFELQATAYVGEDGRLSARVRGSYDLRLTNRLILVPGLEANAYSEAEDERGLGAGLGNVEAGLRLRYEFHRKFAPYVGYVWERSFAGTADRRRAEGDPANEHRFVAGLRMWW